MSKTNGAVLDQVDGYNEDVDPVGDFEETDNEPAAFETEEIQGLKAELAQFQTVIAENAARPGMQAVVESLKEKTVKISKKLEELQKDETGIRNARLLSDIKGYLVRVIPEGMRLTSRWNVETARAEYGLVLIKAATETAANTGASTPAVNGDQKTTAQIVQIIRKAYVDAYASWITSEETQGKPFPGMGKGIIEGYFTNNGRSASISIPTICQMEKSEGRGVTAMYVLSQDQTAALIHTHYPDLAIEGARITTSN